jgi:hypothetical protein
LPVRINSRAALAGAVTLLVCGATAAAASFSSSAHSATAPGAPAVQSAPSSLVGAEPQIPDDVVKASSAPGSTWTPEKPVYGTASTSLTVDLRPAS